MTRPNLYTDALNAALAGDENGIDRAVSAMDVRQLARLDNALYALRLQVQMRQYALRRRSAAA